MSNGRTSGVEDQVQNAFLDRFVRALHDHFNPLLRAIENIQCDTNENRKH